MGLALLAIIVAVDVSEETLEVSLVFGGGFVLGFLEGGVANEDVALFAPESRLLAVISY